MNTKSEFQIMQLSDSFFPSGMFGMSGGLESLVRSGYIKKEEDVLKFIENQIYFQFAPCDCAILIHVIKAAKQNNLQQIIELDNKYYSLKLIKEVRIASTRSGQQILFCGSDMMGNKNLLMRQFLKKIQDKKTHGTYPVCFGIVTTSLGISSTSSVRMMLYSYSTSVVAAAVRLGIIEHFAGQRILMHVSEYVNQAVRSIKKKSIDNIWQLTPITDIFQMTHEHSNNKMFIT
ncbi:MAG: urease accessory protein UreF [Nitrosotalea sp.]